MFAVGQSLSLLYCFHNYALANKVLKFFRVDIMPPTAKEDLFWLLELSFPFPFRAATLALSRPMG
jgi:hypothetical protein